MMAPEPEISLGELWRSFQAFKDDVKQDMAESRNDTQRAIVKIEEGQERIRRSIDDAPYVHQQVWELVRNEQGKRIGELEDTVKTVTYKLFGSMGAVALLVLGVIIERLVQ